MFKHILVPVDGSDASLAALDCAVALAGMAGAKLSILTVWRHHGMLEASLSMVRAEDPGPLDDALRAHAQDIAERAKARARDKGAEGARAFVRNGPVARGIVAFAQEHGVDLIVLGSRGAGAVDRYLLGSVSHKVTSVAECPVMVV
jgi:nucleotide-binding universal stress UspA family protein